jgi:hypothetical protein
LFAAAIVSKNPGLVPAAATDVQHLARNSTQPASFLVDAPLHYLLVRARDLNDAEGTTISRVIVTPTDQNPIQINLRDTSEFEVAEIIEKENKPGYATVPPDHKANWGDHFLDFFNFWAPLNTVAYRGLDDGPKEVKVSVEGVAGIPGDYSLRYGALLRSFRYLNTRNPENQWLQFEGEVVLYNGLKEKPACRQVASIVLESSDGVVLKGIKGQKWTDQTEDHALKSQPLSAYEEVVRFRFEVQPSSLSLCGTAGDNAGSIRAYIAGLPDIAHRLPIRDPQTGLQLTLSRGDVDAGNALVATLYAPGGPPGPVVPGPVSANSCTWTVREVRHDGSFSQPVTLQRWEQSQGVYFEAGPLALRDRGGQLQLFAKVQGTYELRADDLVFGRSGCTRVKINKTLIDIDGAVAEGGVTEELRLALQPRPTIPSSGQTYPLIGRVVTLEEHPVPFCGTAEIRFTGTNVLLDADWSAVPGAVLLNSDGTVPKGTTVTATWNGSGEPTTVQFVFNLNPTSEPPPSTSDVALVAPSGELGRYTARNALYQTRYEWYGRPEPDVPPPGFGTFAVDIPDDAGLLLTLSPKICVPYLQILGYIPSSMLGFTTPDDVPVSPLVPIVLKPSETTSIVIRRIPLP